MLLSDNLNIWQEGFIVVIKKKSNLLKQHVEVCYKKMITSVEFRFLLTSMIEKTIDEWVETAIELGRDIPQPEGKLMFA
jgi:hypothetical protein